MDQKSYVLFMEESQCLLNIIHDKIQPASQPHSTVQVNLSLGLAQLFCWLRGFLCLVCFGVGGGVDARTMYVLSV